VLTGRAATMTRVAMTVTLAATVLVGVGALRSELRALDRTEAPLATLRLIDGMPVTPDFDATATQFIIRVRERVPARADIRLIMPKVPTDETNPRGCDAHVALGRYRWAMYQLLPRAVYCDRAPRYWIYLGVDPATVPPPRGSDIEEFAPGYAIAVTPGASR
jgi:hypothetical protein